MKKIKTPKLRGNEAVHKCGTVCQLQAYTDWFYCPKCGTIFHRPASAAPEPAGE